MGKLIYEELTYQIRKDLFYVHNNLGRFARERQYSIFLSNALNESGISHRCEVEIGDSFNRVDFLVEDKVIIELKARPFLRDKDFMQVKRYLKISGLRLGLLVNFRNERLKAHRILNPDFYETMHP